MCSTVLRALVLTLLGAPAADIPRPEHPRPDAVRPHWANLNGSWDFRFDAEDKGRDARWYTPGAEGFDRKIVVPFGWESELSGIHQPSGAPKVGWYRRTFEVPADFPKGDRVWLHFGAVDHRADVWVNGTHVASHEGGYTPFSADVTDALKPEGANVLVVRAFDPTDPSLPTGKQVGWYTTTSGIWQTVWLESRPKSHIDRFAIKTEFAPGGREATADVEVEFPRFEPADYQLVVHSEDPTVTAETRAVDAEPSKAGETTKLRTLLKVRDPKPWTPETPRLYEITLELRPKTPDRPADRLTTYFGLRTIARGRVGDEPFERILLNGKPIYLRGALDQSFNPKGVYTAPSDEFLKADIELAKRMGTNFLRIHIKPDEPRRLYWADKLGMLVMEDMPNTWNQNATARKAWEGTLREVVARDRNHPSIFAWVDFNETWGLGEPRAYKADKDTQAWVRSMLALTRQLDPTRLVEDNSPCNYDHVEGTDLNSWHFYIDDHNEAKRHIEEVVAQSKPGSAFNYCPDQKMNSAPLINSEYGAVSAGGGDRDVSWGFRDLTTQLRKQPKIQGYIYTELTDIEWEHNGFADYDRTPKSFGYDAFVPGMTPADLQGADFVGYDAPPAIVAKPGEVIHVPLFVSHYSDRPGAPKIRWWVTGVDDSGEPTAIRPQTRPAEWVANGVTMQKPLAVRVNTQFVGALALVLEDSKGARIAANFVNLVVRNEKPQPRVERLDDHRVVLRFAPGDYARARWSGPVGGLGKAYGLGKGSFVYKLKLPAAIAKARPKSYEMLLEASSKAGREKVDWPERVNSQDYPQTDATKWPSTLELTLNGRSVQKVDLPDDPADARGVLSHLSRVDHGSYGEIVHLSGPLAAATTQEAVEGKPLLVGLGVPDDAKHAGGLSLFGETTGAYPFDPTLVLTTEDDLPADLGVPEDATVAVETLAARQVALVRAGDSNQGAPTAWAYTTSDPGPSWLAADFDDAGWKRGPGGFGTPETPSLQDHTPWDTPNIWLRTSVDVLRLGPKDTLILHLFHDEDAQIFVNGKPLFRARGYITSYQDVPLSEEQKALFREGKNLLSVTCKQTMGGQGVDLGLKLLRGE